MRETEAASSPHAIIPERPAMIDRASVTPNPPNVTKGRPGTARWCALGRHDGISLPEMMMTILITMVMMTAAFGALDDGLTMRENADVSSEMHHNVRMGMNEMSRDLILAGQAIPIGGIPVPNGAGAAPINRPGPVPLTFPAGTQVLRPVITGDALGPLQLGLATDLVTIIYADATLDLGQTVLASIAADGSAMTVAAGTDITLPANELQVGDLIMFSNAMGTALQMITAVSGAQTVTFGSLDPLDLNQRNAAAGTIMQLQDEPGTFPPTTATRVWMITYFVDASVPGSPRLMRVVNDHQPTPIAMEIENLQLTYDLVDGATDPAGIDEPVSPNTAADIRKVNIAIGARSHKKHIQTAEYQRTMQTGQVSLRNLSFFDRYQ